MNGIQNTLENAIKNMSRCISAAELTLDHLITAMRFVMPKKLFLRRYLANSLSAVTTSAWWCYRLLKHPKTLRL